MSGEERGITALQYLDAHIETECQMKLQRLETALHGALVDAAAKHGLEGLTSKSLAALVQPDRERAFMTRQLLEHFRQEAVRELCKEVKG